MKRLRRAVFILVIGLLVAAIPVSAIASEDVLSTGVRQSEAQFDHSLTLAIGNGLDPTAADQLMWRYSQVAASKPASWWQAPAVSHGQIDKLNQLQADLQAAYSQDLAARRDDFLRATRSWRDLLTEARNASVDVDDLGTSARFVRYGREASTPRDFETLSQVLSAELADLKDRLANFRSAQAQALRRYRPLRRCFRTPASTPN